MILRIVGVFLLLNGAAEAQSEVPRFEVGPVFSSVFLSRANEKTQPAIGGRFTYNFSPRLAFDSDLTLTPSKPLISSTIDGGRITQGQFGIKAGWRREKWGAFGKLRPGFVSFGETVRSFGIPFETRRLTMFSTDVGAVLEFYPARRIALRYDLGTTLIRYPEIRMTQAQPPFVIPSTVTSNIQFSTSVHFRF